MSTYRYTRLKIRIIVGGPPNSGKSTFSVSLVRTFQKGGVDAKSVDLDPWAPTLELVKGNMTQDQRDRQKRSSITFEDVEDIHQRFKNASDEHDVVIGDAPGGISKEIRPIYAIATHGILVCRDDKTEEIKDWKDFFNSFGIDIIAIVVSKTENGEKVMSSDPIEIILSGLNREPRSTTVLGALSLLIRKKLGI